MDGKASKSAILKELVYSLSHMNDPSLQKLIDRTMRYMPSIGTHYRKHSTMQRKLKRHIDKEDALCVERFGALVKDTMNGPFHQMIQRRVVPQLLHYFETIPELPADCIDKENEDVALFVDTVVHHLGYIAANLDNKQKRQRDQIVGAILRFYEVLQERKRWHLIKPLLHALKLEVLPLTTQQAEMFITELLSVASGAREDINDPVLKEELQVLALEVISRLSNLSVQVCSTEQRQWIMDCSRTVLESAIYEEVQFANKETIVASSASCIVQAGLRDPHLSKAVIEYVDKRFGILTRVLPVLMSKGMSFKLDEYSSLLQAYVDIAAQFPQKSSTIIDSIVAILLKTLKYQPYYEEFTETTVDRLCHILKLQIPTENSGDVSLINGVFTTLYTPFYLFQRKQMERLQFIGSPINRISVTDFGQTDDIPPEQEMELLNIIELMGTITLHLDDARVTELILSRLLRRVRYPPRNVDSMIITQLVNICVLGQPSSYDVIVSEFLNVFKRFLKDTSDSLSDTTIPDALCRIATEMPEECAALREDLSIRIQRLIIEIGKEVRDRSLSSSLIQAIGYLLVPLAKLLSRSSTSSEKNMNDIESTEARRLRTVWFYLVLFRFATGDWRSDWFNAVAEVAKHVPVLTSRKVFVFMQMELELEALIENGNFQKYYVSDQQWLTELLPEQRKPVQFLNHAKVSYLLAVYYLEILRARSGIVHSCLNYVQNLPPDYPSYVYLLDCFKDITDKVFQQFVSFVDSITTKSTRRQILQRESQALIIKCCSFSPSARAVATSFVFSLANLFPQITWNKICLFYLLDLAEAIGYSHEASFTSFVQTQGTEVAVELPEGREGRQALLEDIVRLATRFISLGLTNALGYTHAVLQDYVNQFCKLKGRSDIPYRHMGVSVAIKIAVQHEEMMRIHTKRRGHHISHVLPAVVEGTASIFVTGAEMKAYYTGEVHGITKAFLEVADQGENQQTAILDKVEQMFANRLKSALKDATDLQDFNDHMYRAAAFIISVDRQHEELIHLICWVPTVLFTVSSMQVATTVWYWIFAARPDLSLRLMTEVLYSWNWTLRERIGIFSNVPRMPHPLEVPDSSQETVITSSSKKLDDNPHFVWIRFLLDIMEVAKHTDEMELKIIRRIAMSSLENPAVLSVQPSSLNTRFRLILLALRLQHIFTNMTAPTISTELLRVRIYKAALSWFSLEPVWFTDTYDKESAIDDVNTLLEICRMLDPSEDAQTNNSQDNRVRKLLVVLIGNEVDRITTWVNTQSELQYEFPLAEKYSAGRIRNWATIVETAWEVDPRICFYMKQRFSEYSRVLDVVLQQKAIQQVDNVIEIPEAISYLFSEFSLVHDNAPTNKLIYWEFANPCAALRLLGREFGFDELIVSYAVRCLRHHSPETMLFYLPQLLQALRHDEMGLIFEYLVDTAKVSNEIAHHLLWNTNCYVDEDTVFGSTVYMLQAKIQQNLDNEKAVLYQKDIDFVSQIMRIPADLVAKATTKDQKTALLQLELSRMVVKPGELFLPTNTDIKIDAIDAASSTTLQSAEHTPILVMFECHKVVDEYLDPLTSAVKWTKTFKKSLIFKTGDDVRQDMLAVQLIELFNRIFKYVGLDLFLCPYKIIATDPQSGIIEVVPNSISRDQIGKKMEGGLVEYFQQKYGTPDSESFQKARKNFLKSMAAYSVVCFLLQIKDRHNGNMLFDEYGHMIHIDFGFMFESSPGGDIGWEIAPFKLTGEMVQLMGGLDSEPFRWFLAHGVKAFLAVRQFSDELITLISFMTDTNLPCFKPRTIDHIRARLVPQLSTNEAARFFLKKMMHTLSNVAAFATFSYDQFQKITQNIAC